MNKTYIDLLAMLGIEDAHPGGFVLTKQILPSLGITPYTNILEVGCGSGKTASYLYNTFHCPVTAIDMNENMLKNAKKRFSEEALPISLFLADAEQLPFPPHSFDLVISESVTAFTKVEKSLREYVKVLKGSGALVAIEITAERPLSSEEQSDIQKLYGIEKIFTEQEWEYHFKNSGFQRISMLGRGTLKEAMSASFFPLNLYKLPREQLEIFYHHQNIIYQYQSILGYRIFLCRKEG